MTDRGFLASAGLKTTIRPNQALRRQSGQSTILLPLPQSPIQSYCKRSKKASNPELEQDDHTHVHRFVRVWGGRKKSNDIIVCSMIFEFHHVAIIVSDYQVSKQFYTETLGLAVILETYREERQSWKLDLKIQGGGQLEIFSFPNTPDRPSRPEACGLRHLAFRVVDLDETVRQLVSKNVSVEPVRIDLNTGARFTFFADPDDLPIEIYEVSKS
ncbi:SMU1112c/YaeR family gloxylase I-like metalloprotein [Ruegeria hyattellae]|uniref:SMU1112c/YaeR family gloxylase I-like metalloprotein n=1 Tax=Ruegeria hyattellae TaxID=3233337 RepID=UPI00355C8B28